MNFVTKQQNILYSDYKVMATCNWRDDPDFANKVAKMCYRQYNRLGKKGKPQEGKEWTLVAAVVCVEQQGTCTYSCVNPAYK